MPPRLPGRPRWPRVTGGSGASPVSRSQRPRLLPCTSIRCAPCPRSCPSASTWALTSPAPDRSTRSATRSSRARRVTGRWPGGGWITYQLTSGPGAGLVVYVAEDVTPAVQVGERVTASTVVANMYNGGDGIETGWAMPDSASAESQLPVAGGISGGGPFRPGSERTLISPGSPRGAGRVQCGLRPVGLAAVELPGRLVQAGVTAARPACPRSDHPPFSRPRNEAAADGERGLSDRDRRGKGRPCPVSESASRGPCSLAWPGLLVPRAWPGSRA